MTAAWPPALRALALTSAASAVLYAWMLIELALGPKQQPIADWGAPCGTRALIHVSMAATFALALVRADEAVGRGARAFAAYGWATLGAALAGAVLQFALHRAFGWPDGLKGDGAVPIAPLQILRMLLEYLLWGAAGVYAYAGLRSDARAAERLRAALLGRTRLQRRAAESRLLALQSRVEPHVLFETLARVRSLYSIDATRAGSLLADLVAFLRAALPQDSGGGTTLARELELSRAWLAMRLERPGDDVLRLDADADLLERHFPPHVLLPVMEALLGMIHTPSVRLQVWAGVQAGERVVQLVPTHPLAGAPQVDEVRARLNELHGGAARLSIDEGGDGRVRVVIALADEPPP
ncbi:MAG: histidine kinase [Rubrivivax sp.]|jgi:hypothetical protein|nr:histidine kinase [Rubrivivax sp.]